MIKSQKALWIIDILTIVFVLIALQSIVVCFKELAYFSLSDKIINSLQDCSFYGWSRMLRDSLGVVVPWSKFLLFLANVYAVIRKIRGMKKKDVSPKSRALIIINLLFITLKLIEFHIWWLGYMSV